MSGQFWTVLYTALITFGAAYLGYWLTGKPRLIAFSPNSTGFQLRPTQEGGQPVSIKAGQIIVLNNGRLSATNVQFVAEPGPAPWGYNIIPAMDHKTRFGGRGEWILELDFLGPGENVTVQILNGPQIDSIRSREGPARAVPVIHQRLLPRWFNMTVLVLTLVGLITIGYSVFKLIDFLYNLSESYH